MVVLALCVAGLTTVSMQVRCIDAAREAARLAARGDDGAATRVAAQIAPQGAVVDVRRDGDYVVARVSAKSSVLPRVSIIGQAIAAAEPDER